MIKDSKAFCSLSVDDPKRAKEFYGQKLGLEVKDARLQPLKPRNVCSQELGDSSLDRLGEQSARRAQRAGV